MIPKGPGDRVKTDRRDAIRLVRLLAAGELSFAFMPTVADEHFRDLVRVIEDARGDLMRARHRLGNFVARRGERFQGIGGNWRPKHMTWLRALHFEDPCSQATFLDYLSAVELLAARRQGLIHALEEQVPNSSHKPVIARLCCFRGIETLTAAGLCAEIGAFGRFPRPNLLSGFLGIVPSERTSDAIRRQGQITRAGPSHARRLLVEASYHYRYRPVIGIKLARSRSPGAHNDAYTSAGSTCASSAASRPASSRSPSRASSPASAGRPPRLTDRIPDDRARDVAGARTSNRKAQTRRARARVPTMGNRLSPVAPVFRRRAATNTGS
jgi:transposase